MLITTDGVRLAARHLPVAGEAEGHAGPPPCFVIVHGFTGSHDSHPMTEVGTVLSRFGGVVGVTLRGHGRSSGLSTLGDREVDDVQAGVAWARRLGYRAVVSVGFSMGASAVVRHGALLGGVDGVVSVSGPSRWYYRGTPPMRRLHLLITSRRGRTALRVARGTRVTDQPWGEPLPIDPRAAAAALAPIPLLVVHGDADAYFPTDHAHQLASAGNRAELWLEPGFGHAENAMTESLTARIAEWAVDISAPARRVLP